LAPNAERIGALCAEGEVPLVANEALKPQAMLKKRATEWNAMRACHGVEGTSTPQLLIAYAAAARGVSTVLIGTLSASHLLENVRALEFGDEMRGLFAEMKEVFA
jgi:pyridoxine 4-dehydrogenase